MSGDLHTLARAIGGEVVQVRGVEQVLAPASGHSAHDRSVSILFGQNLPDGFWVTSFGNGDALTERARIRELIARKGDALALPAGQAARATGGASPRRARSGSSTKRAIRRARGSRSISPIAV